MKRIVKAPAKVNLYLRVNGKTIDGYHDLTMIMQTISLYDTLEFEILKNQSNKVVNLSCNIPYIPTDDKNLVVKIVKYFIENYNIRDSFNINLMKMIPTCGGLGGGSSDAASTILFLNDFYNLNLTIDEQIDIASKFGSDIPFFIEGKTCLCEGRGEKITKLSTFNDYYVLIATPNIRVSTKDVFMQYDNMYNRNIDNEDSKFILNNCFKAIKDRKIKLLSKNIHNDLAIVTEGIHNDIKIYREKMLECGALSSMMSGSGPSTFGIFNSLFKAMVCKRKMKKEYRDAFIYISKPL